MPVDRLVNSVSLPAPQARGSSDDLLKARVLVVLAHLFTTRASFLSIAAARSWSNPS